MPKQDGIDTVMTPDKFRTAKRRRFVANFSIQMILRDSLALITTVTISQLKDCTSPPTGTVRRFCFKFIFVLAANIPLKCCCGACLEEEVEKASVHCFYFDYFCIICIYEYCASHKWKS